MATVHKMPSGKWRAQVRRVGHKPLSTVCSSKKEAELWARDIEVKIDRGAHIGTGQRLTVSELFAAYRGAVRSLGRSKLAALINIEKKLGRHRVGELRPITFLNFAGEREREGAGPATVMMDLSFLATALVHAGTLVGAEEAVSRANLALRSARATLRHAGRISKPAQRNRRPTEVELTTLLDHFRCNPRQVIPMADIVLFAISTGMRLGEITRLEWADLNDVERTIIIRQRKHPTQKATNDQVVPLLSGPCRLARGVINPLEIIHQQAGAARRSGRIFPYAAESVSTAFTRAVQACGVLDLHFHDLRHDGVSRMFEAGLQIHEVALVSGHKDWAQLKRYTNLRAADLHGRVG